MVLVYGRRKTGKSYFVRNGVQARKVLEAKIPHYVEQFITNLMSKTLDLWPEKTVDKNHEVDIALTDFQKLKTVAEVKWRKEVMSEELEKTEEKLERYPCRKILVVPDMKSLPRRSEKLEVWDARRILDEIGA